VDERRIDAANLPAHTRHVLKTGFTMSCLERTITDGHAKLTGEGKQQAVPAPNGGARVPRAAHRRDQEMPPDPLGGRQALAADGFMNLMP